MKTRSWTASPGGGSMGAVTHAMDRPATPQLGPARTRRGWPQGLRTTVSIVLGSPFPTMTAGSQISGCSTTARVYRTTPGTRASTALGLARIRLDGGSEYEVHVVVENDGSIGPEELPKLFERSSDRVTPRVTGPGTGSQHHSRDRHGARRKDRCRFGRRTHAVHRATAARRTGNEARTTPGSSRILPAT